MLDSALRVQFPSEYLDGFGHPVVTSPYTLADLTHKYGINTDIYSATNNGANSAVTHLAASSSVTGTWCRFSALGSSVRPATFRARSFGTRRVDASIRNSIHVIAAFLSGALSAGLAAVGWDSSVSSAASSLTAVGRENAAISAGVREVIVAGDSKAQAVAHEAKAALDTAALLPAGPSRRQALAEFGRKYL